MGQNSRGNDPCLRTNPVGMIRAVLFDVDGVLLDSLEANWKFFQNLMTAAGYRAPTHEEHAAIFHYSLVDAIKFLTKSNDQAELQRVFELGKSARVDYPVDMVKMSKHAAEILRVLRQRYQLGIVTSRIRDGVFLASGFERFKPLFNAVVTYEDTELHKPHPDPLLHAAKLLSVDPDQTVYVGDAATDLEAGRAAGMHVILYGPNPPLGSDATTNDFRELPALIAAL